MSVRYLGMIKILFVVCLIATALTAGAQTITNVTLVGMVTDSKGAALPNAKITVTNISTGISQSVNSDPAGRYTIYNLSAGRYDITAEASGFATSIRRSQEFLVGQMATLDFTMQVAAAAQTVEVTANAPLTIAPTDSTVSRVIETQELDNLPTVSRSYSDLAALSPGVLPSSSAGGIPTIGGGTTYQTGYVVDGSWAENTFFGGSYIKFPQDWIQEFSLVSEEPTAEYGRASGGYINAITRSGGNEIHGRVYDYYQNNAMNALNRSFTGTAPIRLTSSTDRLGGMVGGPIRKDKLFYFAGYEFFHGVTDQPTTPPATLVRVGSPDTTVPVTTGTQVTMGKIDWQASSSNKISGHFDYEHDSSVNSGVSNTVTVGQGTTGHIPTYLVGVSWQKTITPTELNEVNFSFILQNTYSECQYAFVPGDGPGAYPLYPSQPGSTPAGDPNGWWATLYYPGATLGCTGGYSVPPGPDVNYRDMGLTDTFSFTHGSQDIKIGVSAGAEHLLWVSERSLQDGAFTFASNTAFNPNTLATYPTQDVNTGNSPDFVKQFNLWGPNLAFFAQDSAKVTPNLTLNIGIRYQLDFAAREMTNNYIKPQLNTNVVAPIVPINTDFHDIAPRFGFAWTPFHDSGKTVVRGGVGMFYDEVHTSFYGGYFAQTLSNIQNPIFVTASSPSQNPWCYGETCTNAAGTVLPAYQQYVEEALAYALATYTIPNFTLGTYRMPNGGPVYTIPAPTLSVNGQPLPAPTASGANVIPTNFNTPGEVQVSGGIGHQFSDQLSVQGDFVYLRGFDQIFYYNSNVSLTGGLVNPNYGQIFSISNAGVLSDRSLRLKGTYRDHRGDIAEVGYTLGWEDDNSPSGFNPGSPGRGSTIESDPYNPNYDWGPSNQDVRNVLTVSGVGHGPLGISLSPILEVIGGEPFTASESGVATAPNCPAYNFQCYFSGYPRNSERLPTQVLLHGHLAKSFRLGEARSVSVFLEGFNVLNKTNVTSESKFFNITSGSSAFLTPTAAGTMRVVQVGGRFDF